VVLENNLSIRAFYEIKFAVDGRVMDVKIIRSSGNQEADMEGLKLIRRMPNWLPAQLHGQRVPATYNLPITFKPE
jgi:protein TonB